MATEVVGTFAAGPLGLALSTSNVVVQVVPGGQAEAAALRVGDALVLVNDVNVRGAPHDEVLAAIRASMRPMALTFERAEVPAASAAEAHAAPKASGFIPSTAAASAAAKQASSMVKGFFGASVQLMGALDRVVEKTIVDSSRQAKQAVRAARISATMSRRPARGILQLGDLSLDLHVLPPRGEGSGEWAGAGGPALPACRAWAARSALALEPVQGNALSLAKRCVPPAPRTRAVCASPYPSPCAGWTRLMRGWPRRGSAHWHCRRARPRLQRRWAARCRASRRMPPPSPP